ncbi:hypothetical protein F5Y05DRAFT_2270 [Hypoxylon sp. FL0543]|nr:hypothetical protein F5Y05DRAFT_2270 [Hypoxylon sp. FL0543]
MDTAWDVFVVNQKSQATDSSTAMAKTTCNRMVSAASVWDVGSGARPFNDKYTRACYQAYANMLRFYGQRFLDRDPSQSGAARYECDVGANKSEQVRKKFKNSIVACSNFPIRLT